MTLCDNVECEAPKRCNPLTGQCATEKSIQKYLREILKKERAMYGDPSKNSFLTGSNSSLGSSMRSEILDAVKMKERREFEAEVLKLDDAATRENFDRMMTELHRRYDGSVFERNLQFVHWPSSSSSSKPTGSSPNASTVSLSRTATTETLRSKSSRSSNTSSNSSSSNSSSSSSNSSSSRGSSMSVSSSTGRTSSSKPVSRKTNSYNDMPHHFYQIGQKTQQLVQQLKECRAEVDRLRRQELRLHRS